MSLDLHLALEKEEATYKQASASLDWHEHCLIFGNGKLLSGSYLCCQVCWFSLKLTQLSRAVKKSRDFSNTILQAFPSSRLGTVCRLQQCFGSNPGTLRSSPWTTAQERLFGT